MGQFTFLKTIHSPTTVIITLNVRIDIRNLPWFLFTMHGTQCEHNDKRRIWTLWLSNDGRCWESRSHWLHGLRCGSAVPHSLGLWVRIPPGAWMFVSCECCVLSGRGLYVGLFTRPEDYYRQFCVSQCDRESLIMRRPWSTRAVALIL
jgi:hypothetical protein